MNIAISGITGLVGSALSDRLLNNGHSVVGLVRGDFEKGSTHLASKLEDVEAVVHLAGAPILKRWTKKWKNVILTSRTHTTEALVTTINSMSKPPSVFISASAVGIYDTFEVHDEYSTEYADDFLGQVCTAWEAEAVKTNSDKTRLAIARLGVVLSKQGGALKQMLLPFRAGVGGRIGDGLQPMPYIHINDLTRGLEWIINHNELKGIFNLVAPQMISNSEFTQALSAILNRPALIPVPEFALKILFGQAAKVLSEGQKVIPCRLPEAGFEYEFPDIRLALADIVK
ncbi:TIGR01777 family oxidoreductase [Marinilabilia rubra]|uniref:TIGR01777 family protein n=1 Tax=Marinilabilia rubra TaxID=2162893 RepID=A0A2U2B6M9_9BACT|nr:TIGR01777 family oxidoreductase [Marinilabilia rubra]PWD98706.1 TIGR01777 family protein [Marinilabilia rubra]